MNNKLELVKELRTLVPVSMQLGLMVLERCEYNIDRAVVKIKNLYIIQLRNETDESLEDCKERLEKCGYHYAKAQEEYNAELRARLFNCKSDLSNNLNEFERQIPLAQTRSAQKEGYIFLVHFFPNPNPPHELRLWYHSTYYNYDRYWSCDLMNDPNTRLRRVWVNHTDELYNNLKIWGFTRNNWQHPSSLDTIFLAPYNNIYVVEERWKSQTAYWQQSIEELEL